MSESGRRAKKALKVLLGLGVIAVLFFGSIAGLVAYLNWSANRGARNFCADIAIGSNISVTVAKAKERKILQGSSGQEYTFYFPGFVFDKAVCEVVVNPGGTVVSKGHVMEYD